MTKMYLFIILFLLKFWVFKSLLYSPDGANIVAPCELLIMNAQTVASKKKKKILHLWSSGCSPPSRRGSMFNNGVLSFGSNLYHVLFFSADDFLGVSSLSKY